MEVKSSEIKTEKPWCLDMKRLLAEGRLTSYIYSEMEGGLHDPRIAYKHSKQFCDMMAAQSTNRPVARVDFGAAMRLIGGSSNVHLELEGCSTQ